MKEFDPQFFPYASKRNLVYAKRGMVATSHPMATQAGLWALHRGGNAVDAALAAAAALVVAEPGSNGIGGDCFAIAHIGGKLYGLNSSGWSPEAYDADEIRSKGYEAIPSQGWYSVSVPGAPRGWAALNKRFSRLSMEECFTPAAELSKGYALTSGNANLLNGVADAVKANSFPETKTWFDTFNPQQKTFFSGETYAVPELGETLLKIAKTGAEDFYTGEIAEKIVDYAERTGGWIRKDDLSEYQARWVDPLSLNYKGVDVWELPPNGQGMTALIALNIIKNLPSGSRSAEEMLHFQMEAIKLAFADALEYIADPSCMRLSPEELLSKTYGESRASLITEKAQIYAHGQPNRGDTVYFCAADGEGNMISMIQSLYRSFGSRVTIPGTGISLQNRAECFSLVKGHDNEAAPRKYPYHTIIPGFLTEGAKPIGPFGIMGGFMQPQAHMQVGMNLIDFSLNPQAALDAPRFCWQQGLQFDMEPAFNPAIVASLIRRGHEVHVRDGAQYGRGQIIINTKHGTLAGATEPRSDGSVIGW